MIEEWLNQFVSSWRQKDVDSVMALFASNVEYWETPFKQLKGSQQIRDEWQIVNRQEDITIMTKVVLSEGSTSAVSWKLDYAIEEKKRQWAGLYIITLNNEQKCSYFMQVGEENR